MSELSVALENVRNNPSLQAAVLISGKPGCFIAGADINMLSSCKSVEEVKAISKEGQVMLASVENMSKPVVAAIMGPCLGGGLEVFINIYYTFQKFLAIFMD